MHHRPVPGLEVASILIWILETWGGQLYLAFPLSLPSLAVVYFISTLTQEDLKLLTFLVF